MWATQERMKTVSVDIDHLTRTYFYFDKPVEFFLKNNQKIFIYPIQLKDSEFFLSSINILTVNKNSLPDVKIIQMSYLEFISVFLLKNKENLYKFINLLYLSLHFNKPQFNYNDRKKIYLYDSEKDICISSKEFDDIKKIILYQNIIGYDDNYINPDLKEAMDDVDRLKNKDYIPPSLERKIAIISSHTGITKKEQLEMTLRSHSLLFEEVVEEVEFSTIRPIALYSGNGHELEHWIYKKKKNKLNDYITSVNEYAQSMGSQQNAIKTLTN